jgi:ABC-2 type transport system permease protein
MRPFRILLAHELRMLLVNPASYIATTLFLLVMGFIFAGLLETYASGPQEDSPAAVFFQLFWLPVLFLVPLLTMKSLAEERRLGTLETLLTAPVTSTQVVLAKFFAAYALYLTLWACTGAFFVILSYYAGPAASALDYGPLYGGYLFIALAGSFFVALGLLASALTRTQAVAGILAFVLLLFLIIGTRYASTLELLKLDTFATAREVVDYLQVFTHLEDFTRGVVDTRQLLYYVSGSTLALLFAIFAVEARQLHS